jgi:Fur family peroxide stress response transcriptional regulator
MKVVRRHSKYVDAIKVSLAHFGHATNAQLCDDLRSSYPHLSDTTVHRITQRLYEDGEIGFATLNQWGAMVYDANTAPHDHFYCESCDRLRDITLPKHTRQVILQSIGPCKISNSLKINGVCQTCINK